ncbi:hypothetical protein VUR80DRAFT_10050 [Thermomyces stellatus]
MGPHDLAKTCRIAIHPGTVIEKLSDGPLANVCCFISTKTFGKAGLLICWDLTFPEEARALVTKGEMSIIAPSWWLMSEAGDEAAPPNPPGWEDLHLKCCRTPAGGGRADADVEAK